MYRISDDIALVLTLDFFPPIVDDPVQYGAIAAANALSDVYAMGGRPITALNIAAFPTDLPHKILARILSGGAEKAAEAGIEIVGGHTVSDDEPKYGLAVTGIVHPDRIVTNAVVGAPCPDPSIDLDGALARLDADLDIGPLPRPEALAWCARYLRERYELNQIYIAEIQRTTGLPILQLPRLSEGVSGREQVASLSQLLLATPADPP